VIIVQLTGGLGNQLFQYAMGSMLASNNQCELKLDLSTFETYEWHEYSLAPFAIAAKIAGSRECAISKGENLSLLNRILKKLSNNQTNNIVEQSLLYDSRYVNFKGSAYVTGYWQSEKYFKGIENKIREDLKIRIEPSASNKVLLDKIRSGNAVSLHIRRGNFVSIDFVNKVHGTCSIDYYQNAVNLISKKISNPVFYIFSDDIPWAKQSLSLNFETVIVDINDAKTDYEDLRLMSTCKHHILANSTFSWWGAWLNPSKEKVVIAPKIWFADEKLNGETADLIPDEWMRI
jgi:hypothetical protein